MLSSSTSIGSLRLSADKRQIGGLLMLTGFAAVIQPIFDIAVTMGSDGSSPNRGLDLALLIGRFFVNVTGILSVILGYMEVVHDSGFKPLTAVSLFFTIPM